VSSDAIFVFALTVIAGLLMASNRIRYDAVALLVVLTLMLSGVLSVGESLSGFGSPVVVLVVCLLIVGEMLARTGVAAAVGDWILQRGGKSERRLLVLIMLAAGILGAVMSSTAIVAIFIPIILRIASDTGLNASRLLLPMSYAALISGMLTLIATTPNIVVHEELKAAGYEGFGFFGFTIIGAIVLVAAIVYILFMRWRKPPAVRGVLSSTCGARSIRRRSFAAPVSCPRHPWSDRRMRKRTSRNASASGWWALTPPGRVPGLSCRLRPVRATRKTMYFC
jgi:di/tricarboxylate transporter